MLTVVAQIAMETRRAKTRDGATWPCAACPSVLTWGTAAAIACCSETVRKARMERNCTVHCCHTIAFQCEACINYEPCTDNCVKSQVHCLSDDV